VDARAETLDLQLAWMYSEEDPSLEWRSLTLGCVVLDLVAE
jgi:hypothetical protein